jgi:hypothetical protein
MSIEEQLQLELKRVRAETDHNLTIGERVEAELRLTLSAFIPSGFGVGHGKIYDAFGDTTAQTDLVVTNPDHPFSFPIEQPGWFLIEGVAAAGEVKSALTIAELENTAEKGKKFKSLRISLNDDTIVMGGNQWEYLQQIAGLPPFILFAFESRVAMKTLREKLSELSLVEPVAEKCTEPALGDEPQPPIDAVCVLGRGVVLNLRPRDMISYSHAGTGEPVTGWHLIETPAALALTLGWLHQMMVPRYRATSLLGPYVFPSGSHYQYMRTRESFSTDDDE